MWLKCEINFTNIQIILQIHLISTSSTLHSVSRYINECIISSSTPSYRAQWLLRRLAREGFTPSSPLVPFSSSSSSSSSSTTHLAGLRRRRIPTRAHVVIRPCPSSGTGTFIHDDNSTTSARPEITDALFLNKALKFPICNLETILLLEKLCLDNLNKRIQARYEERAKKTRRERYIARQRGGTFTSSLTTSGTETLEGKGDDNSLPPPPPPATFLPLPPKSIDIPKRLFRNLSSSSSIASSPSPPSSSISSSRELSTSTETAFESEDLPLLLHILTNLQGNPNSNKGYALAKSVLSRNSFLIEILLEYGADPTIKDYMAVMLAIGRKDLEIVKMLVEREDESSLSTRSSSSRAIASSLSQTGQEQQLRMGNTQQASKKRKRGQDEIRLSSPKRRKVSDRFQIPSEMLELAVKLEYEPLIKYFMSKGEYCSYSDYWITSLNAN